MDKRKQMEKLILDLSKDTECEKITKTYKSNSISVGLVNQFRKHTFIPNKWFDWKNRVNAKVMIIGQDWGPYTSLLPYVDNYDMTKVNDEEYYNDYLFRTYSSRTEKYIFKTLESTYLKAFNKLTQKNIFDDFFFTMSVLFTRQGTNFRGSNNFDENKSFEISYPYVSRQIEIVKPRIILTLGNMPFKVVNNHYKLGYEKIEITKIINNLNGDIVEADNTIIIPCFHPAAHIDPKRQALQWEKVWMYYK